MKNFTKILFCVVAILSINTALAKKPIRVAILGDSYSTFEGEVNPIDNSIWYFTEPKFDKTDVERVEQTWWHMFLKSGKYELAMNNSFSGSTICNTGYRGSDASLTSFIARMNNLNNPDMILIFGATNDAWAGVPIGEYKYSEWQSEELYSFRPAMAYMLSYIAEKYPNAETYFILNDSLDQTIVDSVIEICNHYQTPYIELEAIEKISKHPSIKGMKQINDQVKKMIQTEKRTKK